MKTLQSNFTTPEQSKRLLELGLPADSADLFFTKSGGAVIDGDQPTVLPYEDSYSAWCNDSLKFYYPCWSVGRLIEIDIICHKAKETNWKMRKHTDGTHTDLLGLVYREFVSSALVGDYDFSKLEG